MDREKISLLVDGELPAGEAERCVDRLTREVHLRAAWGRYHLIGDVIRGEPIRLAGEDLADRVRRSLEDEPAIVAVPKPRRRAAFVREWMRPAAGAAVAASVAIAAVISFPMLVGDTPQGPAVVKTVSAPPLPTRYANHSGTRWKNLQRPEVESKLNQYLVDHNEYASPGGMTGVLPYASFVSYDESR